MNESDGYFVYFFPQALEALGEAIKPYLRDGAGGEHVRCSKIDTAGALIEMDVDLDLPDGRAMSVEVMVPQSMVRMIVTARSDAAFGFSPRVTPALMSTLPATPIVDASEDAGPEG